MSQFKRILGDLEGALEFLLASKDFIESRKEFEEQISNIKSLSIRSDLCLSIARHYKHLAQIDGIKEKAKEEAKYFLKKSAENGIQYETQHEMLPEFFNRDIPVE